MLKRFLADESGMEMVEWALVAVLFAIGGTLAWSTLNDRIVLALGKIGDTIAVPPE